MKGKYFAIMSHMKFFFWASFCSHSCLVIDVFALLATDFFPGMIPNEIFLFFSDVERQIPNSEDVPTACAECCQGCTWDSGSAQSQHSVGGSWCGRTASSSCSTVRPPRPWGWRSNNGHHHWVGHATRASQSHGTRQVRPDVPKHEPPTPSERRILGIR